MLCILFYQDIMQKPYNSNQGDNEGIKFIWIAYTHLPNIHLHSGEKHETSSCIIGNFCFK